MNRYIKYGLLAVGAAAALLAGTAAYLAVTFDPNQYKPQIIDAVKEYKHRTLRLDGNIRLTFFPSLGADLGQASLSERDSDKEFAEVGDMHVSLALLPLLAKKVVVDQVTVSGLKATLVKFNNGKSNIDDLLGGTTDGHAAQQPSAAQPVQFDIAAVHVDKSELGYRDEASGTSYALRNIKLDSGRIAIGVPAKVDFAARIEAGEAVPGVDLHMVAALSVDPASQSYAVKGLDLQAKGAAFGIENLALQASGDVGVNLSAREYSAKKFAASLGGVYDHDNVTAKLDVPALNLARDKFGSDRISLDARLDGARNKVAATLVLPGLEGTAQFFKSSAITLDVDLEQPQRVLKVKLSSPVAGNFEIRQFNLADLRIALSASGDGLPNRQVNSELRGSVQVDGSRESMAASLAGGLLQSQLRAKVMLNGFDSPQIRFDADVDKFDTGLFLPQTQPKPQAAPVAAAAEQPFDLSLLRKLNLDGSLRLGALKAARLQATELRVDVQARNGMLHLDPLAANLYGGSMSGAVTVNAAPALPAFSVNGKLDGVDIAPLLAAVANFDMLEGRGKLALDLNARGNTVGALRKGLDGNVDISLVDGAVRGINIARTLRSFGKGSGAQTQAANKDEKTDFSELKASFKVNHGLAHNDNLVLKAPLLRMSGSGDIDIGNGSMDYLAKATLAATLRGQGGRDKVAGITVPVRVSGPFANLSYRLDFGEMVKGAVKQKLEEKKQEVKKQLQQQLQQGLKDLLK